VRIAGMPSEAAGYGASEENDYLLQNFLTVR
jgi:hypothetical protein